MTLLQAKGGGNGLCDMRAPDDWPREAVHLLRR
jgi:hypothetical protein